MQPEINYIHTHIIYIYILYTYVSYIYTHTHYLIPITTTWVDALLGLISRIETEAQGSETTQPERNQDEA